MKWEVKSGFGCPSGVGQLWVISMRLARVG
jgi:hypothetical protein